MKLTIIALALAVAGCSTFQKESEQVETPPVTQSCISPNLANGYILLAETKVRNAARLKAKEVTQEEINNVNKLLEVAQETLNKARDALLMYGEEQTACDALNISDVLITRVRQDIDRAAELRKKK